jgi:hypothetical protein
VLAFAAFSAPAFFSSGMAAAEFFETIHQSTGYRELQSVILPASSAGAPVAL